MKKYYPIVLILLTINQLSVKSQSEADTVLATCKNEKFATAEPGTCLTPKAYRLLNAIDNLEKNPYNNEFAKRLLNLIEPRIYKTLDVMVPGKEVDIPVRIYYPTKNSANTPTQIVLFIHGGGFMFGSIEEYDMAIKKFAKVSGKIIVSVDYRLAPAHPFPAGINDAETVLKWISKNSFALGGYSNKIALMGDSAGGNIAAVLALKCRDEGSDIVASQVLFYPSVTFVEEEYPSRVYFLRDEKRSYLLTEDFLRLSKSSYLPDSIDERNPYVSPLEADLIKPLPPSLIFTAEVDPLRDEGRLYARKLQDAGQEVSFIEYPGILHGFFNLYMIFDEAKESMKIASDFVNSHPGLNVTPQGGTN